VMEIFLDGKKASGPVTGSKVDRFDKEEEALPIQIGAMNTGVLPADAAIDSLRISNGRRWRADFEPEKNPVVDERTTVLFRFDGDLRGSCPDETSVRAEPGSAG